MPAEPNSPLAESARRRHEQARDRASRALRQAEATGEPVTYAKIAAAAAVSRAWLYTQPDVRAAIERLRDLHSRSTAAPIPARQRASEASLVRRLETAHKRNQQLAREITELREQLAAAHGQLRAARRGLAEPTVTTLSGRRPPENLHSGLPATGGCGNVLNCRRECVC